MSKSLKYFAAAGVPTLALVFGAHTYASNAVQSSHDALIARLAALPRATAVAPSAVVAAVAGEQPVTLRASIVPPAHAANPDTPVVAERTEPYGLGRAALPEEVAAWDIDVAPDGTGLPVGSMDVWTGEEVFVENCAVCHGDFAEGADNWPPLAGGQGTLADEDPVKTIGSYWPHLTTAFDYVNRSMPFGNAQSLTPDEVYGIINYILFSNDLVGDDFVLSNENFMEVTLPNREGFVIDDREESERHFWTTEPCMSDCKPSVEVTMRAAVLDVTPDESMEESGAGMAHQFAVEAQEPVAEPEAAPAEEAPVAALDPELVAEGERVFRACRSCHKVGADARNGTGPMLNGVFGATAGQVEGFRYSNAMADAGAGGLIWNAETLAGFLADPRGYLRGTKMSYRGLRSEDDIAAMIAYLQSVSQ